MRTRFSLVTGLFVLFLAFQLGCSSRSSDNQSTNDAMDSQDGVENDGFQPDTVGDLLTDLPGDGHGEDLQDADGTLPDAVEDIEPDGTIHPNPKDEPTFTSCGTLPVAEEGTCSVESGSDALLIRGNILALDEVFEGGSVLLNASGTIVCVGCDCSDQPDASGATVLTCAEGIVSPGLINAHDHLTFCQNHPKEWGDERFEHRHDWRKGKRGHSKISAAGGASENEVAWCEARQVMAGTTSIAGSGQANGFLRNLDRNAQEGLGQPPVEYQTFPLGDSDGTLLAEGCNYPGIDNVSVLENDCYLPHVAEGIDKETRNEFLCLSSDENGSTDLTESNSVFIHGIGLKAIDGAELAANGTAVVWSPRTNISLYGNTAPVTMYHNQGVLVGLGTDWTPTGSIDIRRELACAAELNENQFGGFFTNYQLWLMATYNNAMAMAVDDVIGQIGQGLIGDIAIYKAHNSGDYFKDIIDGSPADTVLVLRAGEPLFGDADLIAGIPSGQQGCEEISGGVCGTAKALCTQAELGKTLSQLEVYNGSSYDLIFCAPPEDEPSCVPFRNPMPAGYAYAATAYAGVSSQDDLDGDGIDNSVDNCPSIFNPIRPVDEGVQGDHDSDGVGDVCDPCPLDANTEECTVPNLNDKDNDGYDNSVDNCPQDYNPDQEDADDDGQGDLCDNCPYAPNPNGGPCPASIYDIKAGEIAQGSKVEITGVVTALAGSAFFMQVATEDQDTELQARFSGIFIYVPTANPDGLTLPARGDLVTLAGVVTDYYGQLELNYVTTIDIVESNHPLPEAVPATAGEVGTDGALATPYEGVLVQVEGVVTELNPAAGDGDQDPNNEYVLDDALRVNDYMYLTTPFPEVGDTMYVTGILRFANQDSKLEPRDAEDVSTELAIRTFGPELVYAQANTVAQTTIPALGVTITSPAPAGGVVIALASLDTGYVELPATIAIPEGQSYASIPVTTHAASEEPVLVTASYGGDTFQAAVLVVDPSEVPAPVSLLPDGEAVLVDGTKTLTLTLNIPAQAGGTTVSISSFPTGIVAIPGSVVVPEGTLTVDFDVTGLAEGSAEITTATTSGSVSAWVEVITTPPLGLVITEVLYNVPGDDTQFEWVEIYNGTGGTVDMSEYSLANGGTDYTYMVAQLQGTVADGDCYVVGGPVSVPENYNPVFDMAYDFPNDIQNSGDKADGVALFHLTASQVNASSIPIDAVIYGDTNANGLIDASGTAPAPHVGNAPAGSSIERQGNAWAIQPIPTPNDCSAALGL